MAIREVVVEGAENMGHNFPDHYLAHQLLDGLKGIELGASSHNSFHLEGSINVAPADDEELWRGEQIKMNSKYAVVDLYGEANNIPLPDNSQDYVISSHSMEHVPDLVGAFIEIARVLKDGGILFMIVPKRGARAEDADRPISTPEDFAKAYNEKWTPDTVPEEVTKAAGGRRQHYWVFSLESLKEVLLWSTGADYGGWDIIAEEQSDSKAGNGHTLVARLRKPAPPESLVGVTREAL